MLLVLMVGLAAPVSGVHAEEAAPPVAALASDDAEVLYTSSDEADWLKAAALYRKAADSGDTKAMVRLGTMYEEGKGLPSDVEEAAAVSARMRRRRGPISRKRQRAVWSTR
jgi:TPR repeat protein